MKLRILVQADRDLARIADEGGLDLAMQFLRDAERALSGLLEHPEIGRVMGSRSGMLPASLRRWHLPEPFSKHLAFYRVREAEQAIEVIRVLHGARALPPSLEE